MAFSTPGTSVRQGLLIFCKLTIYVLHPLIHKVLIPFLVYQEQYLQATAEQEPLEDCSLIPPRGTESPYHNFFLPIGRGRGLAKRFQGLVVQGLYLGGYGNFAEGAVRSCKTSPRVSAQYLGTTQAGQRGMGVLTVGFFGHQDAGQALYCTGAFDFTKED